MELSCMSRQCGFQTKWVIKRRSQCKAWDTSLWILSQEIPRSFQNNTGCNTALGYPLGKTLLLKTSHTSSLGWESSLRTAGSITLAGHLSQCREVLCWLQGVNKETNRAGLTQCRTCSCSNDMPGKVCAGEIVMEVSQSRTLWSDFRPDPQEGIMFLVLTVAGGRRITFFEDVTIGRIPMLQCTAPHPRTHGYTGTVPTRFWGH